MEKIWVLLIAIAVFLMLNLLSYITMKVYVRKAFGRNWLTLWGNKLYFWQTSILISVAGTVLIMYLLKVSNILEF